MLRIWAAFAALLAASLFLAGCGKEEAGQGTAKPPDAKNDSSIFVYCAAGIKDPIEDIRRRFTAETGIKVEITYQNSGQLLGQIETSRIGDVYIPGDVGFVDKAAAKKLVAGEAKTFCYFVPTIYVRKGNPKGIRDLSDLAKPGVKLVLADPSAAIGQLQEQLFKKNALDEAAIKANRVATQPTVTEVAMAVKLGSADAGIIWDALRNYAPNDAEVVPIPVEKNVIGKVAACTLACAKNPRGAAAFLDYLASEKGREVLVARGFTVDAPK